MSQPTSQRIVPGAPPPKPLSKSQKKRRKARAGGKEDADGPIDDSPVAIPDTTAAALTEKAPETPDIAAGAVAPELVVQPDEPQSAAPVESLEEETEKKRSAIVEVVHKRLKASGRKLARIATYASADPKTLNEDQQRTLKTLPILESVHKELEEVEKAIKAREAEKVQEKALRNAEAARAEKARLAAAVSEAEKSNVTKTVNLLSFLRLHSSLSSRHITASSLNIDESESGAIFAAADLLLGEESASKQNVVIGFFTGEGELQGIPYTRLSEITQSFLNPATTDATAEAEEVPESTVEETQPVLQEEPSVSAEGDAAPIAPAGSFQFMQSSELETPEATPFEDGAEWVERSEVEPEAAEAPNGEALGETPTETAAIVVNGHVEHPVEGEVPAPHAGPIDWADDEAGLPPIAGLQAKFGTSGSATPEAEGAGLPSTEAVAAEPVAPNGVHAPEVSSPAPEEDDGFTPASRGGRGRGRGGFRGTERGAFRGFRGGDRGGFRGGDRGFRGGFRGGDRGFRGRPSSGEWRTDGEIRGRGRGRGRGGFGEPRGGATATA